MRSRARDVERHHVVDRAHSTSGRSSSGTVSPTGDRLIVVGEGGTAIIDDGGNGARRRCPAPLRLGHRIDELATRTSSCVAVIDHVRRRDSTLVSLDDGSIVAEADGRSPMLPSVDGCTVATAASGLRRSDRTAPPSRPPTALTLIDAGRCRHRVAAAGRPADRLSPDRGRDRRRRGCAPPAADRHDRRLGRRCRTHRSRPRLPPRALHATAEQVHGDDDRATHRVEIADGNTVWRFETRVPHLELDLPVRTAAARASSPTTPPNSSQGAARSARTSATGPPVKPRR